MENGHRVLEEEGVNNIALRLSRREDVHLKFDEHICECLVGLETCRITWEVSKVSSHSWNFPVFLSHFVWIPPTFPRPHPSRESWQ